MKFVLSVFVFLVIVSLVTIAWICFFVGVASVFARVKERVKEKLHHDKTE